MVIIISEYLTGWEKRYQLEFSKPRQDTMTKISGLRYILLLMPTFVDIAFNGQHKFNSDFVVETIKDLETVKSVNIMDGENVFSVNALSFRGEGATIQQAEDDGKALKAYASSKQTEGFNPFS